MSEPDGWQHAYTKLIDYINEHPGIDIGESRLRVPESVRPEFYRLFNQVRAAFIKETFGDFTNDANILIEQYNRIETEVIKLLGLEKISLPSGLQRFLHSPIDELVRGMFDPLFDLLNGKIDIVEFEEVSSEIVKGSFGQLCLSGYEKWVVLSLLKMLEADTLLQVSPRGFRSDYDMLISSVSITKQEVVPLPKESKCVSFNHPLSTTFVAPDFIVYSTRLNRYIGSRSLMSQARALAKEVSSAREWLPIESVFLEAGSTLVYLADKPEEISLIADSKRICRPDLILVCEVGKDWYKGKRMEKIKLQHISLKPSLGTYIVSLEPVQEQAYEGLMPEQVLKVPASAREQTPAQEPEKLEDNIRILTVDFDRSKLEPIIDVLRKPLK